MQLDAARHDRVNQLLDESYVSLSRQAVKLFPIVTRCTWPSVLDLIAASRLELEEPVGRLEPAALHVGERHARSVYGR